MAATKQRLKKSVDAVLTRDEMGAYFNIAIPRRGTSADRILSLIRNDWGDGNIDDNADDFDMCNSAFRRHLGTFGLRNGSSTKIRITIERIK